jgi:phosphopantothenoylcysteine decarboxylase/phosphopantothenate--cysteine ligase
MSDSRTSEAYRPGISNKRITLAVTGSIAAYKSILLARLLSNAGARVPVVLSRSAKQFVGAASFSGLTGEPVLEGLFDGVGERHVELAKTSDLVIVAPATADLIARAAAGRADDLLTALLLCTRVPILMAPAMHPTMWEHPATERNVAELEKDGLVRFVGPRFGKVASGDEGLGRMAEPEEIFEAIHDALSGGDLSGRHLVITAGPTLEDLDPVRFIGNRSSGKMGYALAERARARGARVSLVSGPTELPFPTGVEIHRVRSALELQSRLDDVLGPDLAGADAVIMAAAVGDYRAKSTATEKLKRNEAASTIELEANPDILAGLGARRTGPKPVLVGFAVETGEDAKIEAYARHKLEKKRVDLVVANAAQDSFGKDDNRAMLVDATNTESLGVLPKSTLADRILDRLKEEFESP